MKLIVMIGISGSGKSTVAAELAMAYNAPIVSADEVRRVIYGSADIQGDGQEVFREVFAATAYFLSEGSNVIIDNTNTTVHARKTLLNIAKRYNAEMVAYLIECDIKTAMQRQRGRKRQVPFEVIARQFRQLQESKKNLANEFDEVIVL